MKLPPNFAREWVEGSTGHSAVAANGWKVRIGNKAVFLSCRSAKYPGKVRQRLEQVLGIDSRPKKTDEELLMSRERARAQQRRNFRNKIARGEDTQLPWLRARRTLNTIKAEEQTMAIAQKWASMGEYRR